MEEQTKKMSKEMEASRQKNKAIRLNASSSRKNKQIRTSEHSTKEANNDKIDKKRIHEELHNLPIGTKKSLGELVGC